MQVEIDELFTKLTNAKLTRIWLEVVQVTRDQHPWWNQENEELVKAHDDLVLICTQSEGVHVVRYVGVDSSGVQYL